MEQADVSFVLLVTGFDESAAQTVRARQGYRPGDIRYEHRYADIFVEDELGLAVMDYARLHEIVKD